MEGTLEDPLVKDPAQGDPGVIVKDIVIPNGVNGSLDDHVDELGDSSGGSNKDDTEDRVDDEKGEDIEDEPKEDENTDDNVMECAEEDEQEEGEEDNDDEDEEEEDREEEADGGIAASEKEVCVGVPMDSEMAESAECASEENIVCAVSSKMQEIECNKDYRCTEGMEVEADHSDNSDVECLDENVTETISENEHEVVMETSVGDVDNAEPHKASGDRSSSGSSDVQQLNDSVEMVEGSGGVMDTSDVKICEENGSCGSPDIEEIMDSSKSNGHNSSQQEPQTGAKDTPKKKPRKQIDLSSITPRRSSRNIKRTSYIEKELEEEPEDDGSSDIEEIKPEDPLACIVDATKDKENSKLKSPIKSSKTTIVVSDTKRLVEIAAGSKSSKGGKKEPTLVIIDTNSILSGRGGIPVGGGSGGGGVSGGYGSKTSSSSSSSSSQHQQHHHHHHHHHPVSSSSSFSVLPMGHTQTMYPNMRTTITPVPMSRAAQQSLPKAMPVAPPPAPAPQILPTLTDDMFVVEAPSFIVPYVYEKPPLKPLKDFVTKLEKSIAECEKEEEEEKKKQQQQQQQQQQQLLEDVKKCDEAAKVAELGATEQEDKSGEDSESEAGSAKKAVVVVDTADGDNNTVSTVDLTEKGVGPDDKPPEEKIKAPAAPTYFDLPLGKFFMQIGVNLVQEFVQTDLLRTQKRKQGKHGTASAETQLAINSLIKNLEFSKENNEPFHLEMKKCEFCSFKTESALVMQHHLETPHMRNYAYKCNFCPLEVRSPHDILFHMEAEHNTRGRLERGPAFHQCPNCPFEDNQKGKLTRHILACAKKFRPERNLEPATDWEPPAKIPRLNRPRQVGPVNANALAMAMGAKGTQPLLPKLLPAPVTGRGRGRPPMQPRYSDLKSLRPGSGTTIRQDNVASMMYRPTSSGLLVPTSYQFGSNQIFQVVGGSGTVTSAVTGVSSGSCGSSGRPTPIALVSNIIDSQSRLSSSSSQNTSTGAKSPAAKLLSQPSISITPLPRTTSQTPLSGSGSSSKPGGKNTFVICEICDGYIKDLEQLRNHMQWIHKVKIHPKMIYNRPPLNCQKCQFRFFTDQGLERHLLGSHGLVTSSMQEAANKGKDAGRCPACGRVYQWKLLNHVARDHGMTLKPAHLSYKCTVCTATFGMYKQFENHVYSAHSVVAKKVMDKKNAPSSPSSRSNDSLLKPLKINDEITIIPQPAKPTTRGSQGRGK